VSKSISKSETSEGNNTSATTNPPRFLGAALHIGRAFSLTPLYKHAIELLESPNSDISKNEAGQEPQRIFEQLYSEQEHARLLFLAEERAKRPAWRNWLADIFSSSEGKRAVEQIIKPNEAEAGKETPQKDGESEFGITLDYSNSLFQDLMGSAQDLQFVTFGEQQKNEGAKDASGAPSRVVGKGRAWMKSNHPMKLPLDLSSAPGPFSGMDVLNPISNSNSASDPNPNPESPPLDNNPPHSGEPSSSWSTISLLTNTVTPSLSIPAAINFHATEPELSDELWNGLWFHNSSRRLLVQQVKIRTANPNPDSFVITTPPLSSSDPFLGREDSDSDSDTYSDLKQDAVHYLDIRPGKTPLGAWTDEGRWVSWKSVCGGFGEGVFGDGLREGVGEFDFGGEGEGEEHGHGTGEGRENGKGEGRIGGVGEWVEEGEGFVKGLWGMVVGDGDTDAGEEKEKGDGSSAGSGGEGVEGGFQQFVGLVESKEEDGEGGNKNKNESQASSEKAEGEGWKEADHGSGNGKGDEQGQKQKFAQQQQGGIRDDDRIEGGKEGDLKHDSKPETDDYEKGSEDKNDGQKVEVENNERLKDHDGHTSAKLEEEGKDDAGKVEEGKVEEGVVRYVDENGDEKIEKMQKEEEEDRKDENKLDAEVEGKEKA